jgi:hypothetical protein
LSASIARTLTWYSTSTVGHGTRLTFFHQVSAKRPQFPDRRAVSWDRQPVEKTAVREPANEPARSDVPLLNKGPHAGEKRRLSAGPRFRAATAASSQTYQRDLGLRPVAFPPPEVRSWRLVYLRKGGGFP